MTAIRKSGCTARRHSARLATMSIFAALGPGTRELMTVVGSGQPADYRDEELELIDDYDPELDLLDDLDDWDED